MSRSSSGIDEGADASASREAGLAVEIRPMMRLALPVVLSELGWIAMGVVDVMMVGGLGPEAIGAAGIGNIVFFSIAIFGIGLLLGMDTVISQSFGAGDVRDCHRSLVQGVYLALAVSVPLMALTAIALGILPKANIPPTVQALATPYLAIQNLSLAPLLVFFALRRYLQGMNLALPVLVALGVANVANLFGNWVFVYGRLGCPALGVAGSAWATLASRVAMLAFLAIYALMHAARTRNGLLQASLRFDAARMRLLIQLGLPTAIQLTLEIAVFCAAALLAAKLGEIPLAAHEIVLQVAGVAFMVPLGVSSAGAVRVGQAIGRNDPRGASRSGWTALGLGAGFMALSGLTMLLASGPILSIFSDERQVLATARSLLIAAAVFQVFDGLQVVGSGILRGLGETRIPMYATLAAHWAIGLPIGYVIAFPMRWGVIGLWIGLASGLVAAGVMLLAAWVWRVRRLEREIL